MSNPSAAVAAVRGKKGHFPFNRSDFPCSDTPGPTQTTVQTPNLDALATEGTVFPLVHVGGNVCKPSRATMLLGRYQRHVKYLHELATPRSDYHSIAWWLQNGQNAPQINEYKSYLYLWGKAEVFGEADAGFEGGEEKAGTKIGKFRCEAGTQCPGDLDNRPDPR